MSDSLRPHGLYSPWNSSGQNTGVGSLSLLQGIFPTQGSNPGLLHCRWILYQLSHKGSPRILEWVAYPFSSRSSWPRNGIGFSYITGGIFTNWAIRAYIWKRWKLIQKDTHTPLAALFTVSKTWKQLKCLSTDNWLKNMWYVCTVEYYSAITTNEIM